VPGAILAGSDLLLVQATFLKGHHPSAKQIDAGAAVHRSLEGLQFVDLSFSLSVAPRLRYGIANGIEVLAYCPRKSLHPVGRRPARIDQPGIQPLRRSTTQQASKTASLEAALP